MKRLHNAAFVVLLAICVAPVHVAGSADQQPPEQAPTGQPPPDAERGPRRRGPQGPPSLPPFEKTILVLGAATGFQHDSISDGMVTIRNMGKDTGMWQAYLRTDYEWITKGKVGANGKNLDDFDALVFVNTTGRMELSDSQKQDLLSFVHDDGKAFVGVHAALDANYDWPEYAEMIGGWFDAHPWNTFDAPILLEDPTFPAVRHFPKAFTKRDEIYQAKQWSRDEVNVLLRLDETKLDYENNPRIRRTDRDFAVAWSKMYGKGRVFYSTLGHTNESWTDPDVTTMYFEAIKWALGLTEGSTESHPKVGPERTSP
ncbi:MAG: ThuA domain-containing protein [Luteitalea sp.]|nr:ThuA domain-containing protein [Luteitalea sp.]